MYGPFKDCFRLDSFHKITADQRLYSSTSVEFTGEAVVINDGFEFNDGDGDHLYERDDYYVISGGDIDAAAAVLPGEYKNESILAEYNGAEEYYNRLPGGAEKHLFLCILKYYKLDQDFDRLFKLMAEHNINYTYKRSTY
jgi:hypothetical protein